MMTKLMSILLLATPLVISPFTNESFEFPKMFLVYFLGSLIIFLEALKTNTFNPIHKAINLIKKDKTFLFILLFIFFYVVATLFSTHHYTSMWGYFSRFNGGLISQLVFFGIYLTLINKKENVTETAILVALTVIPTSIFALLQTLEKDRVYSTFGQPNWYAAYVSMVLPITLYLGLKRSNNWYLIFYLGFLGLWKSNSLSGIIAFFAGILMFSAINLSLLKTQIYKLTALATICLITAYFNSNFLTQRLRDALVDISIIKPEKINQALTTESEGKFNYNYRNYSISDSGFIRKWLWVGSLELWVSSAKTFFIGTGPETFAYEFQKFRPSFLNYSSEWNYILNKPHNYYLELLTQLGIFGASMYLLIMSKVIKAKDPIVTPSLSAFFVSNIFGWPSVYTNLLFWVFLAYTQNPKTITQTHKKVVKQNGIYHLIIIGIYLYINILFAKYFIADIASKQSNIYLEKKLVQKSYKLALFSTQLNPKEPLYQRQIARIYIIKNEKTKAYTHMQNAYNLNPKNLATIKGLIPLYYFLSLKNTQETATPIYDDYYLHSAKNFYIQVSNAYPKDVGLQTQIAKYQKLLNLNKDLETTKEKIQSLRPDLLDWYIKL